MYDHEFTMKGKAYRMTSMLLLLVLALVFITINTYPVSVEAIQDNAHIQFVQKWAVIPEVSGEVTIDGELDEMVWQEAVTLTDFVTVYNYDPAPDHPTYHVAYDADHLYIGGTFSNEDIEALAYVEVILSPYTAGGIHYSVSIPVHPPDRPLTSVWHDSLRGELYVPDKIELTDFSYATKDGGSAGQFYVEMAIPLTSIASSGVFAADEWRMNIVHLFEINTKPMYAWTPIQYSYYMDRSGASVSYRSNVTDHGRLGSVFFKQTPSGTPWIPDNATLTYIDFTSKQISFTQPSPVQTEFHLEWKDPAGDWEPLFDIQRITEETMTTLTFRHPEPLQDGLYQLRISNPGSHLEEGLFAILGFDREELIAAGLQVLGYEPSPPEQVQHVTSSPASSQVQAILDIIPDQNGFRFVGLPEMPELAPDALYQLSGDGKSLISVKTGKVYPNDEYKEDKEIIVTGRKGQAISYPYYEDEEGKRYFITAHLWHLQKQRAITSTETISRTDPLGAARLLFRFAQAAETYVPTTDDRWYNFPMNYTSGPPFNYWGGKWDRFYMYELNALSPLMRAYAAIQNTDALQVLSDEVGVDVDAKIKEEIIAPALDYLLSYPIHMGNLDFSIWVGFIHLAKAVGDPDHIHRAAELLDQFATQRFMADGSWHEITPSYHNQTLNQLVNAINQLKGWTDPPGYISPRTGKRFENLDLYQQYPILDRISAIPRYLAYPNGHLLPVQDTWANQRNTSPIEGPYILPAAGVGRMSIGEGLNQSQLYLQFVPKYGGHVHREMLNINLYAEGQELLPDLGYTMSMHRFFSTSTLGHNTVVVDSSNMDVNDVTLHGGNIERFAQVDQTFQVMRAEQAAAYAVTDEYRREPWYISYPDDPSQGYVLDLFRVTGGDRHEYTLNGDANHDAYFQTDLTLNDYGPYLLPPGTEVREAESYNDSGNAEGHYAAYIYVKDVKQAELDGENRYQLTLETFDDSGAEKAKLKITGLLEAGQNELYLGRSPSIRSSRLGGTSMDTNDEVIKYDMPKMVLRRDGTNLTSVFATVLEPYSATSNPRLEQIERLEPDQAPEGAAVVKVSYGNTTDIILSSPHYKDQPLVIDDIVLHGEMGFIRIVNGDIQKMVLVGGTLLKKGNYEVTDSGSTEGVITDVWQTTTGDEYDALVTDRYIAADVVGQYVIVTHPDGLTRGFKIKEIQTENRLSTIILDNMDPGFTIAADGGSQMTSFPLMKWTGEHRFTISNISSRIGVGHLRVTPERTLIAVGESTPVSISLRQGDGTEIDLTEMEDVSVQSSDLAVATVEFAADGTALVSAVSPGKTMLTVSATWQGRLIQGTAEIYVMKDPQPVQSWTPMFTDENDQEITDLHGQSQIYVKTQVKNTTSEEQPVIIIAVLNDPDGNVLQTAESSQIIPAEETLLLTVGLELVDQNPDHFIKVFIWNSKMEMHPYAAETLFPIEGGNRQ